MQQQHRQTKIHVKPLPLPTPCGSALHTAASLPLLLKEQQIWEKTSTYTRNFKSHKTSTSAITAKMVQPEQQRYTTLHHARHTTLRNAPRFTTPLPHHAILRHAMPRRSTPRNATHHQPLFKPSRNSTPAGKYLISCSYEISLREHGHDGGNVWCR